MPIHRAAFDRRAAFPVNAFATSKPDSADTTSSRVSGFSFSGKRVNK